MGIFNKIKDAIFGHPAAAAESTPVQPSPSESASAELATTTAAPVGGTTPITPATLGAAPTATQSAPSPTQPVEIAPILDAAVKSSGQKLDWKHSIVDLMKALGMDASLAERKELAEELGYTGEKDGSAAMNTWLHKALLKKLSENGGKVPAELLD